MPRKSVQSSKRAATRRRLIAAATEVLARNGFHAASVDEIAEQAGFSIGALYGNFAGKDQLLFAVFDEHVKWFEERLNTVAESAEPGRAMAEWIGFLGKHPEQFLVFTEFWAYAVRKPKVRQQFARRMTQMREAVAEVLRRRAEKERAQAALPPDLTALLALAIARGLALEKLADPRAVPDAAVGDLLAGLLLATG